MIVKIQNSVGEYAEWCMLEFQGEILGNIEGEKLGDLLILPDNKAEMEIGQHFLEGTVISLKSPFLMIDKDKAVDLKKENESQNFQIEGIIKKKIIFKTRPKPLGAKKARIQL